MFNVNSNNVVLVMHLRPDVDAYASACVISDVIKQKYPNKTVYVLSTTFTRSFFLKPLDQVGIVLDDEQNIPEDSTVYLLDHHDQDYSQLKDWSNPKIKEIIVIDHHFDILQTKKKNDTEDKPKPAPMRMFVDTDRICTTDLIFEHLMRMNSVQITKDIATAIYLGIFSDCMRFAVPVTLEVHKRIVLLGEKYGAEINEKGYVCSARWVNWYRAFAEWWEHAKFATKDSGIMVLDIKHSIYKNLAKTGEKAYSILFDLLACKKVRHLIAIFQNSDKRYTIKVLSRFDKVIKEAFPKAYKDKIYSTFAFNEKQVIKIKEEAIAYLENWDRENK